jgi:hypothetical protein
LLIFQNIVRFKAGGKAKAGAFAYDGKKWLYEPSEWGYQWKDINDN